MSKRIGPSPSYYTNIDGAIPAPPVVGEPLLEEGKVLGYRDGPEGTVAVTSRVQATEVYEKLFGRVLDLSIMNEKPSELMQRIKKIRTQGLLCLDRAESEMRDLNGLYKLDAARMLVSEADMVNLRSTNTAELSPAQGKALICEKLTALDKCIAVVRELHEDMKRDEPRRDQYIYQATEWRRYGIYSALFPNEGDTKTVPFLVQGRLLRLPVDTEDKGIEDAIEDKLNKEDMSLYQSYEDLDELSLFSSQYTPVERQKATSIDVLPDYFPPALAETLKRETRLLQRLLEYSHKRDKLIRGAAGMGKVTLETIELLTTRFVLNIGKGFFRVTLTEKSLDVTPVRQTYPGVFVSTARETGTVQEELARLIAQRTVLEEF